MREKDPAEVTPEADITLREEAATREAAAAEAAGTPAVVAAAPVREVEVAGSASAHRESLEESVASN